MTKADLIAVEKAVQNLIEKDPDGAQFFILIAGQSRGRKPEEDLDIGLFSVNCTKAFSKSTIAIALEELLAAGVRSGTNTPLENAMYDLARSISK